jgi:hypothetical protein
MTIYQTRFKEHSIHSLLSTIQFAFGPGKLKLERPDLVATHARLFKVLDYLRKILDSADPDFVPALPPDQIEKRLTNVHAFLLLFAIGQEGALAHPSDRATFILNEVPFLHSRIEPTWQTTIYFVPVGNAQHNAQVPGKLPGPSLAVPRKKCWPTNPLTRRDCSGFRERLFGAKSGAGKSYRRQPYA